MSFAGAMVVALVIDALIGWPDALYRRVGHPVTWLGRLIGLMDRRLNHGPQAWRRVAGVLTALAVIAVPLGLGWAAQAALPDNGLGTLGLGVLAWPLVALRSMHQHVVAVARPLAAGDTEGARAAVAMIVGRDPQTLDDAGIARAATESLAENTGDGIVAPVFWGAVAGLPGIAAYKAINTLDSMIGYRTPRHLAFGWASARIDDGANWVPERLTGVLFALVSLRPAHAIAIMRRDAHFHRSPNAGWPEAAMAGALDIRLSGPRVYHGALTSDPFVNAEAPDPTPADLHHALALYRRAMGLLAAVLLAIWGLWGW